MIILTTACLYALADDFVYNSKFYQLYLQKVNLNLVFLKM